MVPNRGVLGVLALAAALASCDLFSGPHRGNQPAELKALPRALTAGEQQVVAANNAFAFGLLREVVARDTAANTFISPLSASMALGMTLNGAAGATLDGMRTALGFGQAPLTEIDAAYQSLIELLLGLDGSVDVRLANSIWSRQGFPFRQTFYDICKQYFDAEVKELDFASPTAAPTINAWVKQATGDKITEIVRAPIPDSVVMYLINAVYFKGSWRDKFDAADTRPAPFTRDDGGQYAVSMMHRTAGDAGLIYTQGVRGLELPYGRTAFVMDVLMPFDGRTLRQFVASLDTASWRAWMASAHTGEVHIGLPRFRLEWDDSLNQALKAMGMQLAFAAGQADFTAMSPEGRRLFISNVRHKTYVDVNEEGTEAAAATSVETGVVSGPLMLVVDRPFIVAIRERLSGTILFLGAIGAPQSN